MNYPPDWTNTLPTMRNLTYDGHYSGHYPAIQTFPHRYAAWEMMMMWECFSVWTVGFDGCNKSRMPRKIRTLSLSFSLSKQHTHTLPQIHSSTLCQPIKQCSALWAELNSWWSCNSVSSGVKQTLLLGEMPSIHKLKRLQTENSTIVSVDKRNGAFGQEKQTRATGFHC